MGSKSRYLIFILLLFYPVLKAQEKLDYGYVDSLSYDYYKNGEWNKLISFGQSAIDQNIDYKYLRQRIGYAFFVEGNYYDAKIQFEKALTFDSYDQFSLEYLYYSYLNTGKEEFAGVLERRMDTALRKALSINRFTILESVDFEYNYKYAAAVTRSNPQYLRVGVNTKLGYRVSLYQSYSDFHQVITVKQNVLTIENPYKQPEYFALLKYNFSGRLLFKAAYHYIQTSTGTTVTPGSLFLFAASKDINSFSLELVGSVLNYEQEIAFQSGIHTGYSFPGRSCFYLSGTLSGLFQQSSNRLIYDQKAGFKLLKKVWLESYVTLGRLTGYNDYDGLYVYNSYDPTTFRCGETMYLPLGRNITMWAGFGYESKEYLENSYYHYNQFSYLGGIKWKL
jgi:tetratricopeptide (TPR) repeat protein